MSDSNGTHPKEATDSGCNAMVPQPAQSNKLIPNAWAIPKEIRDKKINPWPKTVAMAPSPSSTSGTKEQGQSGKQNPGKPPVVGARALPLLPNAAPYQPVAQPVPIQFGSLNVGSQSFSGVAAIQRTRSAPAAVVLEGEEKKVPQQSPLKYSEVSKKNTPHSSPPKEEAVKPSVPPPSAAAWVPQFPYYPYAPYAPTKEVDFKIPEKKTIIIKDPSTGNTLNLKEAIKARIEGKSEKVEIKTEKEVEKTESTKVEIKTEKEVEKTESTKVEIKTEKEVEKTESTKVEIKTEKEIEIKTEKVEKTESTKVEIKTATESIEIESTKDENTESKIEQPSNIESSSLQPSSLQSPLSTKEEGEISDDEDYESFFPADPSIFYPENVKSPQFNDDLIIYSYEFLIQFREYCKDAPENFPDLNNIYVEGDKRKRDGHSYSNRSSAPRRHSTRRSERRGPRGGYRPRKPTAEMIGLHKADNAWGKNKNEQDKEQVLYRQVRALLNKLTLQTFDSLSNQVIELDIKDDILLKGVIDIIFAKAVDEPNFGSMYAQLCLKLSQQINVEVIHDPNTVEAVKQGRTTPFRRILLNKCQDEYNKKVAWSNTNQNICAEADEEYERIKIKRRALGNIIFIGQLYKIGLLNEKIINTCIFNLLDYHGDPEEEEVESLCKLMTTVGSKFDRPEAHNHLQEYFKRIKLLSEHPKLSSRIQFMLLDLIDLRSDRWVDKKNIGPKTIKEIHRDAAEEQRKEQEQLKRLGSQPTRRIASQGRGQSDYKILSRSASQGSGRNNAPVKKWGKKEQQQQNTPLSKANMFSALEEDEKQTKKKRSIKAVVEEYLSQKDIDEVALCIQEQKYVMSEFVQQAVNNVIEKRESDIVLACAMLKGLLDRSLLKHSDAIKGFAASFEFLEDLATDVPNAFTFAGRLVGSTITCNIDVKELVTVSFASLLASSSKVNPILKVIPKLINQINDVTVAYSTWITLVPLVKEWLKGEPIEKYIESNNLFPLDQPLWTILFTQKRYSDCTQCIKSSTLDKTLLRGEFLNLFCALAFKESYDLEGFLSRSSSVFIELFGVDINVQLDALNALYSYWKAHGLNPELLDKMFNGLYDSEMIEEDAFKTWSKNAVKLEGYENVQRFIMWLEHAQEK